MTQRRGLEAAYIKAWEGGIVIAARPGSRAQALSASSFTWEGLFG